MNRKTWNKDTDPSYTPPTYWSLRPKKTRTIWRAVLVCIYTIGAFGGGAFGGEAFPYLS
jgi:hypothetical protein